VDLLRIYLFAGLLAHKAVWEALKRRQRGPGKRTRTSVTFIKAVKILILFGILIQTLLPDVFPISNEPQMLRTTGAALFTFGLAVAVLGRIQLGDNWLDIESAAVKRDQVVVSRGVYGYVRHPIYVGDLVLLTGLELALNSWLVVVTALLAPIVLRQAIREESILLRQLPGYNSYCRRTKRFIPYIA
jgi:protein-S-isoprenylcysteine O-methyltransferase Ste14